MAEILGAISASTNLLEHALSIIKCLRKAQNRQKELVCLLRGHEDELESIKTILRLLQKKENTDLHTASLGKELDRMKQVQDDLAALLKDLDPTSKTKINQFLRQLLDGAADEKKLSNIMNELAQVKASILLCIQMANVGVMRDINRQIVADAAKIERIDSNLRKKLAELDDYDGLRIARLIKGRRPSSNGHVPLTQADIRSLSPSSDGTDSASETLIDSDSDADAPCFDIPAERELIIKDNMSQDQSYQINAPIVEQDFWKDFKGRLVIMNNVSKDQSAQFNHPNTLTAVKVVLDAHAKNMEAIFAPQKQRRGRTRKPKQRTDVS